MCTDSEVSLEKPVTLQGRSHTQEQLVNTKWKQWYFCQSFVLFCFVLKVFLLMSFLLFLFLCVKEIERKHMQEVDTKLGG